MKKILFTFTGLFAWAFATTAQIEGFVFEVVEGKQVPIENASVFFKNSKMGTTTCDAGTFYFKLPKDLPDTLIIRVFGYHPDTIPVAKNEWRLNLQIQLFSSNLLEEVVIKQKRANSTISRVDPRSTEYLSAGELKKAACCNLSESFETNATVDVNLTDGISGAKKIAMLGLDGAYTQIQFENIPILQNLEQPYGLLSIPGTWINGIQITKGSGTVVNGYESMAGLINLEYHQPDDTDLLFLNGYASSQGRAELNVQAATKINEKWSAALFVHGNTAYLEYDRNDDGFRDIPVGEELAIFNRWKYKGDDFIAQFAVKGNLSEKNAGQLGYNRNDQWGYNPIYGVGIINKHLSMYAKTGWTFKDSPWRSVGVVYNFKHHELDAVFGRRYFNGQEQKGYVNVMYEDILGSTMHVIKTGASLMYNDLNQSLRDSLTYGDFQQGINRTEIVPGVYGEYTYTGLRSTAVAGLRYDQHNMYGGQLSPRFNWKYSLTEKQDFRFTIGRGFRVPNYITDNFALLATNVPWVVQGELTPEISWNIGASWLYDFKMFNRKAVISADVYRTQFENQIIADRDEDPTKIIFTNLNGTSFSNVFQIDFRFEPIKNFEIKSAYKFLDVKATMGGELMQRMMIPQHRGFVNAAYTTRNNRWEFDLTASVFSAKRLAPVVLPDGNVSTNNRGEAVPMLSGQITHKFKKFEVYLGGENLLDYRIKDALVDPSNPFGEYFDATRVWAPIAGVNIYAGFRFSL